MNGVLKKLAAMRSYMRDINLGRDPRDEIPAAVGMEGEDMYEMFRLLALAKYDERYVIPTAHAEQAHALEELATDCPVSEYGGGQEIFGEGSGGAPTPVAVENFRVLQQTQSADAMESLPPDNPLRGRVNLLNWDGRGMPDGMFPGSGEGGRPMRWRRHRGDEPGLERPGARGHLAGRLAAPRLPRRGPRGAGPDAPGRGRRAPRGPAGPPDGVPRHPRGRRPRRAPTRVRRHLRRDAEVLAAPDVLQPRRHPPARRGPRRVQAGVPQGRRRVRHRRRAARPPLRRPRVRRRPRRADRVDPPDPAPGRHRGAQGRSRTPRLAVASGGRRAALDVAGARRRRRGGAAPPRGRGTAAGGGRARALRDRPPTQPPTRTRRHDRDARHDHPGRSPR